MNRITLDIRGSIRTESPMPSEDDLARAVDARLEALSREEGVVWRVMETGRSESVVDGIIRLVLGVDARPGAPASFPVQLIFGAIGDALDLLGVTRVDSIDLSGELVRFSYNDAGEQWAALASALPKSTFTLGFGAIDAAEVAGLRDMAELRMGGAVSFLVSPSSSDSPELDVVVHGGGMRILAFVLAGVLASISLNKTPVQSISLAPKMD
jgi:hypothetical protein